MAAKKPKVVLKQTKEGWRDGSGRFAPAPVKQSGPKLPRSGDSGNFGKLKG